MCTSYARLMTSYARELFLKGRHLTIFGINIYWTVLKEKKEEIWINAMKKHLYHTSWVAVVTPTNRPKSVRNCCLIELFCGVVCVATLPLWHFCWYRGFCHRTGSDLFLFVLKKIKESRDNIMTPPKTSITQWLPTHLGRTVGVSKIEVPRDVRDSEDQ